MAFVAGRPGLRAALLVGLHLRAAGGVEQWMWVVHGAQRIVQAPAPHALGLGLVPDPPRQRLLAVTP